MKWKHFPRYWPFVRGIHRSPVNSPHKGQWRGALMFSLICVWINGWVNYREAGDLRRNRDHCDVIVMWLWPFLAPVDQAFFLPHLPTHNQSIKQAIHQPTWIKQSLLLRNDSLHLSTHLYIHTLIHVLMRPSLIDAATHPFAHSPSQFHTFTRSLDQSHLITHSLTHPRIHLLKHSLAHTTVHTFEVFTHFT